MRIAHLAAIAAIAFPVPALAQDASVVEAEGLARAAEAMSDPSTQRAVSAMAESVMGAMLDMPVAPLLRAAEGMTGREPRDIDPDTTVAQLAGPEAASRTREMSARLPQMMQTMAAFTYALDGVLPQLRGALEDAARKAGERAVRESDKD